MDERLRRWRREHLAVTGELRERLSFTFAALARALDGDAPARRPADGGWSTLEVVEHVTLADRYLLLLARKIRDRSRARLLRGDDWPEAPPRHAHLEAVAHGRDRWQHPAHMTPGGAALEGELRQRLRADLAACLELLEEMPEGQGTLHRIRMSRLPPGADRLDLAQYLDFLGRHAQRHLRQLERNRA